MRDPCDTVDDDLQLAQSCIARQSEAWAHFLTRFEALVCLTIRNTFLQYGRRASEELILDLKSELICRLIGNDSAKLRQYQGRCSLSHWLKVVARNLAIDHLRKSRSHLSLDDPSGAARVTQYPDSAYPPDIVLEMRESGMILDQLFEELGARDQRFIRLYYQGELTFDQIAERMGTTVGAMYSRKSRIQRKLASLLRRRRCRDDLRRHPVRRERGVGPASAHRLRPSLQGAHFPKPSQ